MGSTLQIITICEYNPARTWKSRQQTEGRHRREDRPQLQQIPENGKKPQKTPREGDMGWGWGDVIRSAPSLFKGQTKHLSREATGCYQRYGVQTTAVYSLIISALISQLRFSF